MKTNSHILFLGKRLEAIKAAKKLGLEFSVIQNKIATKQRKYFEISIAEDSNYFDEALKKLPLGITHVIPITEFGVRIYQRVIDALNLKNTLTESLEECFHKVAMKKHAHAMKIPTTKWLFVEKWNAKDILEKVGEDIVIKQVASSGSRGQTFLNSAEDIRNANFENVLVEKRIYGKEFSIESYVRDGQIIFNNFTDYHSHHICNVLPMPYDWQQEALALHKKIITSYKIKTAMTHVEFYKTSSELIFGEIAIRSPGGYIMPLLDMAYGFSSWDTLIKLFLSENFNLPKAPIFHSACWILHPGKGQLTKTPNFDFLKKDPSFVDIKNALKKGFVELRSGSGEDYGRILFKNEKLDLLLNSLETTEKNLKYAIT